MEGRERRENETRKEKKEKYGLAGTRTQDLCVISTTLYRLSYETGRRSAFGWVLCYVEDFIRPALTVFECFRQYYSTGGVRVCVCAQWDPSIVAVERVDSPYHLSRGWMQALLHKHLFTRA